MFRSFEEKPIENNESIKIAFIKEKMFYGDICILKNCLIFNDEYIGVTDENIGLLIEAQKKHKANPDNYQPKYKNVSYGRSVAYADENGQLTFEDGLFTDYHTNPHACRAVIKTMQDLIAKTSTKGNRVMSLTFLKTLIDQNILRSDSSLGKMVLLNCNANNQMRKKK